MKEPVRLRYNHRCLVENFFTKGAFRWPGTI